MATADLYHVRVDFSTNNRLWGFNFWLEEIDPAGAGQDGLAVAKAVSAQLKTEIRACLSSDAQLERVHAAQRHLAKSPAGREHFIDIDGGRASNALPNDNCWRLQFVQIAHPAKHNGGVNLSGISRSDHKESRLDSTFATTQCAALAAAFLGNFDAQSPDTGRWRLVILSKTITPFTHVIGSAIDVTDVRVNTTILTQSQRRNKVPGFASA